MAEIEFAGLTGDGMVRQAAFKGLREDKPADEVEAEDAGSRRRRELAEARADVQASRQPGQDHGPAVVMGVTISNPDKALWPDGGDGGR